MPDCNMELLESVSEIDWAWLAGAVDGEGNLRIYKNRGTYCQATLRVFNTHYNFIEKVSRITQGNILGKQGDTPFRTRTCYYVQIGQNGQLWYILRSMLPYLTAKRKLAELVIEYLDIRNRFLRYTGREQDLLRLCEEVTKENSMYGKVSCKDGGV